MKIHNMIRTLGMPGSEEFDLPTGWELKETVYLGPTNDQEKQAGFFKVLYVLVPVTPKVGRPAKNEWYTTRLTDTDRQGLYLHNPEVPAGSEDKDALSEPAF